MPLCESSTRTLEARMGSAMGTPTKAKARRGHRGGKAASRMTVAEARRAALAALAAAEARRARFAEAEAARGAVWED